MSVRTIPAKNVMTCDICGITDETPFRFATHAHLTLKQDALDHQGSPCANATIKLDLCDDCALSVNVFIKCKQEPGKVSELASTPEEQP